MRLTKTQHELLQQAANHPWGRVTVLTGHYSTRRSGILGTRKHDAAIGLVAIGLLARSGDVIRTTIPHGDGTYYGSDFSYEITEAGRAALKRPASISAAIRQLSATQKFCE